MKNLLLAITLFSVGLCNSQVAGENPRISWALYQDTYLAFFNDGHGNKPFTTDVRLEIMVEGNYVGDIGSLVLGITVEYADLHDYNFLRYGVQGGFNFRNYQLPFNLGYYDNAIYIGAACINRNVPTNNDGYLSLELSDEFAIFITEWMSFNLKATLMQRGDLGEAYGDKSGSFRPWDWKFNGYAGVKFYLNL